MKQKTLDQVFAVLGFSMIGLLTGCEQSFTSGNQSTGSSGTQALTSALNPSIPAKPSKFSNDVSDFPSDQVVTADFQTDGSGKMSGITFQDASGNPVSIPAAYALGEIQVDTGTRLLLVNIPKSNGSILSLAISADATHYVYTIDGSGLAYFDLKVGVQPLFGSTLVTGVRSDGSSIRFSLAVDSSSNNLIAQQI